MMRRNVINFNEAAATKDVQNVNGNKKKLSIVLTRCYALNVLWKSTLRTSLVNIQ